MRKLNKGFSLVELVIVVVIIGVLAAIAIPRLSRGAAGAADSALQGNLKVLRTAIDLYASEHGGAFPNVDDPTTLLTSKTSDTGSTTTGDLIYGPYLRAVPSLPVGAKKGQVGIGASDGATIGWIYIKADGTIKANTTSTELDAKGTAYNAY